MMRSKWVVTGISLLALIAAAGAPLAVFAYSVNGSAPSTTDLNVTSATWQNLSAPFENFFNDLASVSSTNLPGGINPSTEMQSVLHTNEQSALQNVLHFIGNIFSRIIAWLIGLANQFAAWVIGLINGH